jgi:Ni/Co efflux regulator RcnB
MSKPSMALAAPAGRAGRRLLITLMVSSLCVPATIWAQGNSDRNDRGRGTPDKADERDNQQRGQSRGNDRNSGRTNVPERNRTAGSHDGRDGRGAGPDHSFRRGDRLPTQFRHRNYVVNDWRGHHLSAPPRGYQWVQTGADYVLVAVATGVILQLLLHD